MSRISRNPRRARLDRTRILQAALELVERDGLDALTMRALGRELGVEAMALYYYFPSKDALLDAIVGQLTEQVAIPSRGSADWTDAARQISRSYREVAQAHPKTFRLLASRPLGTPRETATQKAAFDLLLEAGFDKGSAALAYRAIANYALGSVLEELTARAPERTAADPDAAFEFGLDVVLAGLQAKLSEAQKRQDKPADMGNQCVVA